jgi:hypothetical protein
MMKREEMELILSVAIFIIGMAVLLLVGGDAGWAFFGFILLASSFSFFLESDTKIVLYLATIFWVISAISLGIGISGLTHSTIFGGLTSTVVILLVIVLYVYESRK